MSQPRVPPRWAFFSLAVSSLLVVSLWLRATAPSEAEPVRAIPRSSSIAVLPFANATPDSANDYLGYGVATELTRALGELAGLRVASRSSAFALGRVDAEPGVVGRRLGVGTVLQGNVLRSADRLRITARLVDVDEGFDLWSETYERTPDDLLTVQGEIERAVAAALRVARDTSGNTGVAALTRNLPAYDAYLSGRYLLDQLTPESARRAIAYLSWAIHLDSTFALAYAGLAEAHLRRSGVDGVAPIVAIPLAEAAAVQAIRLDTSLANPHAILGTIRFGYDREWRAAEAEFRRAIAMAPGDPEAYPPYARFLLAMGRNDEALEASRRALQLSPLAPRLLEHLGWYHLHTREYPRAREALWRSIGLDSTAWRPRFDLALVEQATGNYPDAIRQLEEPLRRAPERTELQTALGQVYAASGHADEAREILVQLLARSKERYVSPYLIAALQASLGQRNQAFASLGRAVKERSEQVAYLRVDPRLDSLRSDRRFAGLLKQVQLP